MYLYNIYNKPCTTFFVSVIYNSACKAHRLAVMQICEPFLVPVV